MGGSTNALTFNLCRKSLNVAPVHLGKHRDDVGSVPLKMAHVECHHQPLKMVLPPASTVISHVNVSCGVWHVRLGQRVLHASLQ